LLLECHKYLTFHILQSIRTAVFGSDKGVFNAI